MNAELFLNSGKTLRPVTLSSDPKNLIHSTNLSLFQTLEINGLFENDPIFGKGQLAYKTKLDDHFILNVLVSQQVTDHLISSSSKQRYELKLVKFDHSRSAVLFEIDIKLSPTKTTTSVERVTECDNCMNHVCPSVTLDPQTVSQLNECLDCLNHVCSTKCTSCETHVCNPSEDSPQRSEIGDALIAIVCYYYSKTANAPLYKESLSKVFKYWRTKLSECNPSEGGPAEAWHRVDEIKSRNGTELLSAMLRLHDFETQRTIIDGKTHDCDFLESCPMNHVNELDDDTELDQSFGEYLKSLTKLYFIDTYFYSRPAKIGLNILTRMYSDGPIDLNLHPLGLLKSSLTKYDHYSPVIEKPNFKRRERKDSIVSTDSNSKDRRRRS